MESVTHSKTNKLAILCVMLSLLFACNSGKEGKQSSCLIGSFDSDTVAAWTQKENLKTDKYLTRFAGRESIRKILIDRTRAKTKDNIDTTFFKDLLYIEVDTSLSYQKYLISKTKHGGTKTILNLNDSASNRDYIFKHSYFSDNGRFVLCLLSYKGSDWLEGLVSDGATGKQIGKTISGIKFSDIVWYEDEGFYYSGYDIDYKSTFDKILDRQVLYYHSLFDSLHSDQPVLGHKEYSKRFISASKIDHEFIYAFCQNGMSENDLLFKSIDPKSFDWKWIAKDEDSNNFLIGRINNKILYLSNNNAPNYRLLSKEITSDLTSTIIIPENDSLVMTNVELIEGKLIAHYLHKGKAILQQFDETGAFEFTIVPSTPSSVLYSYLKGTNIIQVNLENFYNPHYALTYNLKTGKIIEEGDLNKELFISKIVSFKSTDGLSIPMYLTYKRGLAIDGKNPVYLSAYGGFGVVWPPHFQEDMLLWMENGGIVAWPLIRGGGELGTTWHNGARYSEKINGINDFVSAAQYLVEEKYTTTERIMATSRSYGGFLVGAATVLHPSQFGVSIPSVGVYDLLHYDKFSYGVALHSEFGIQDSVNLEVIRSISPIHNISSALPSIMIIASSHDDRVYTGHSYGFYQALNKHKNIETPVLLRTAYGGHYFGGGSSRISKINELTDMLSFAWSEMNFEIK